MAYWGSDRLPGKVRGLPPPSILELTMNVTADQPEPPTAIRTDLGAIFVSLELSRSSWLITSLSPGGGRGASGAGTAPALAALGAKEAAGEAG
jgi:transposase